ncbi:MAG: endonuclease V [Gammaproteobacteria bacterium]|nr:MAG: endonuclease V [Gammaproteobacteria bacterium]RTZ68897.1 MAG: endonuclease V [Aquificaceae bacterium]
MPENYSPNDLEKLKKIQTECGKKVKEEDLIGLEKIRYIGGMDLTFKDLKRNPTDALVSLVVVDIFTLKPVEVVVIQTKVEFPYIPTFLAFRELPALLEVYDKSRVKPEVFFIDGQGKMHPRRCGIASHFGVETNTIAVGVAKSHLYGKFTFPCSRRGCLSYVKDGKEVLGVALRTKTNTYPVFVSVGNNISLPSAVKLVLKTSRYRIPEPTRLAHNVLQRKRKELGW